MKKTIIFLALVILALVPLSGFAQLGSATVNWEHTFASTDTAATTKIADTSYSSPFRLGSTYNVPYRGGAFSEVKLWTNIQAYWTNLAHDEAQYKDSNWTADTFFVSLQSGWKKADGTYEYTVTTAIDTFVATGSSNSTLNLARSATVFGDWGRLMLIRRDSLEATAQSKIGRGYGAEITVYFTGLQY